MIVRTISAICIVGTFVSLANADLLLHYGMDEGSGTTIHNDGTSGPANDGTIDIANTFTTGVLGTALTFDETIDSTFTAGPNPLVGSGPRTLNVWVNNSGSTGQRLVMSLGSNGTGTKFDIDIDNGTGYIELGVGGGRSDSSAITTTAPVVNDGTWRMITVIIPDLAAPTVTDTQFYIDGVFAYGGNNSTRAINTAADNVWFGRNPNQDVEQAYLGATDEVALWDEVLTDDEIAAYMSGVQSAAELDASDFNQLKILNDLSGGVAVVDGIRWDYADGLSGDPGISGTDPDFTMVIDSTAGTGAVTSGMMIPDGDVNLDGDVDPVDLQIIADNFRLPGFRTDGDLSGDGVVEWRDYFIWRDDAPAQYAHLTLANVPEPTAVVLGGWAALGLLSLCRRRS